MQALERARKLTLRSNKEMHETSFHEVKYLGHTLSYPMESNLTLAWQKPS